MGTRRGIGVERAGPQASVDAIASPADLHPALALLRTHLRIETLYRAQSAANIHGTCPLTELAVGGEVNERALYRALSVALDRPFTDDADAVVLRRCDRAVSNDARALLARDGDEARWLLAPNADEAVMLSNAAEAKATVVPPSTMRALIDRAREGNSAEDAVHALHRDRPQGSARTVINGWQGFVLAALIAVIVALAVFAPVFGAVALHAVGSMAFLCCVALRALAARTALPPRYPPLEPISERDLPVYTVLAVLYREAPVVPQLIEHLDRLHWPRAKLDVRLVCEADDHETLAAIEAHGLPPHMRVVRVPPGLPRTKPKALNYALDAARGEFVVVYDAEDRPHPLQLREAYQRFGAGPAELGCLQAALQIDNGRASFLSRGFTMEYAALFRGLLPWLAERGLPLPLGGTSNHFRLAALRDVGAWDPFNVTEDADLGFRLYRRGWRVGTISRPTLEAAPETWRVWRNQRTRWLKGWAQTWLVHMRSPVQLWHEAGAGGFAILQIAMLGMVGSALLHPLMFFALAGLALAAITDTMPGGVSAALLAIDAVNVALGYAAMLVLTRAVLRPGERWLLKGSWWRLPLYWLHLFPPAWRAVWELFRQPHRWSKTPHEPVARTAAEDPA